MKNSIIKMQARGIFISLLEACEDHGVSSVTAIFESAPGDHKELFKELKKVSEENSIFLQSKTVESDRVEVTIIAWGSKVLEGEPF